MSAVQLQTSLGVAADKKFQVTVSSLHIKKRRLKQKKDKSEQPFICFEVVPSSHCQPAFDTEDFIDEMTTNYEDDILDLADDELRFYDNVFSMRCKNMKHGGRTCRSTSSNKQPKVRPKKLVTSHEQTKELKRIKRIEGNYSEQKINITESLAKRGLRKFGYGIYSRRAESHCAKKASAVRINPCHVRSQGSPSVLKYELSNDRVSQEDKHLLSIVELQHRELTPEDYELLLLLDMSVAPKTINHRLLEAIPSVLVSTLPNLLSEHCSICMAKYVISETVKKLSCEHFFHATCIDHWLSTSSQNCPLDGLAII